MGKYYHMASLPPPPRKKSHGRTSPSIANLLQHTFLMLILGQHVRFVLGGGGGITPINGELLLCGILSGGRKSMGGGGKSHVTPDSPYSGNMMYPQQKNQFHTIIINHISLEICLHVSVPVNLHIISACK